MNGWVKLHRELTSHWLWEGRFSKGQAWVDLLMLANHKPNKVLLNGTLVEIKRGQLAYSMVSLADRWLWSRQSVMRFISLLKSDSMVDSLGTPQTTIITILNYEQYQTTDTGGDIKRTSDGTTDGHRMVQRSLHKQEVKKEKNVKKERKSMVAFNVLWQRYPNRTGKKDALRHFEATVKTPEDLTNINTALTNYLRSDKVKKGFIQNGSTWFNNWQDWVNPDPVMMGEPFKAPKVDAPPAKLTEWDTCQKCGRDILPGANCKHGE